MTLLKFFNLLLIVIFSELSYGTTHVGFSAGYVQDQRSTNSKDSIQHTLFDAYLYTPLFKTKNFYLGVEYLLVNRTQPNGADANIATLASRNPMIGFKLNLGRSQLVSTAVMYCPTMQADYTVSSVSTDLWTGTSYAAKLSLQPELSPSTRLTLSVLYYSANYNTKSSTSTSKLSGFSHTSIIPTMGIEFYF